MGRLPDFDYIVVGGGSSGCVVASRLSENDEVSVLLLEAGGADDAVCIQRAEEYRHLWGTQYDWGYETSPQPHLASRSISYPRGRVLGGSSSINGMLYVRGHRRDFDNWAALGNRGWSYKEVLPYFLRSEDFAGPESEFHAKGGPLPVRQRTDSDASPSEMAFIEAVAQYGLDEPTPDFNGRRQENGAGFHQVNLNSDNGRASASAAFLSVARMRPNLRIETGAFARRLIFKKGRAHQVEFDLNGQICIATADAEIILSAGAIDSPKLLMHSGIGSHDILRPLRIDCVADLKGVGMHLQDHLIVGVSFRTQDAERGSALDTVGLFMSTPWDSGVAGPDMQFHFFPDLRLGPPPANGGDTYSGFTIAPTLLQPRSEGKVTLSSRDPRVPARIDPGYLRCADDLRTMIFAVRVARDLARMPAFDPLVSQELLPGKSILTNSDLREYIINHAETSFHPVGTCRMGYSSDSVVDDRLRVHGVEGLRVIDASVMPRIVSANTNAASIMIGERGAEFVQIDGGLL